MNRFAAIFFALGWPCLNLFGQTNLSSGSSAAPPQPKAVVVSPKTNVLSEVPPSRPRIPLPTNAPAAEAPMALSTTASSAELDPGQIALFRRISDEGLLKRGPSQSESRYVERSMEDRSFGAKLRSMFRSENDHAAESSVGSAVDIIFPTGD